MIEDIKKYIRETLEDILFLIIYGIVFFLLTENPEYHSQNIYDLILKETQ